MSEHRAADAGQPDDPLGSGELAGVFQAAEAAGAESTEYGDPTDHADPTQYSEPTVYGEPVQYGG
ncbi:MAG TPA: hypothetical protein VH298_13770, partial [Jatrophihabitans sp.]|nr:hypothetical protein [Jatrophihabitans sp.]